MKIEGWGEIRNVGDWESFLDAQDAHISIHGDRVVCRFDRVYEIPLVDCDTPTKSLIEAFSLYSYLSANEPRANGLYLAGKFIDLVRAPMKLPHDLRETFDKLSHALLGLGWEPGWRPSGALWTSPRRAKPR